MFSRPFQALVRAIKLVRKDDDSGVWAAVELELGPTDEQLAELGADVVAMVQSAAQRTPRGLPFTKATLAQDYEGLRLEVYGADNRQPRFEANDCTAAKLVLLKGEVSPSEPVLRFVVTVPPVKQSDLMFLVSSLGGPLRLGLNYQQGDLPGLTPTSCADCGTAGVALWDGVCAACHEARGTESMSVSVGDGEESPRMYKATCTGCGEETFCRADGLCLACAARTIGEARPAPSRASVRPVEG